MENLFQVNHIYRTSFYKNKALKLNNKDINSDIISKIKIHQNIIIDDLDDKINEEDSLFDN